MLFITVDALHWCYYWHCCSRFASLYNLLPLSTFRLALLTSWKLSWSVWALYYFKCYLISLQLSGMTHCKADHGIYSILTALVQRSYGHLYCQLWNQSLYRDADCNRTTIKSAHTTRKFLTSIVESLRYCQMDSSTSFINTTVIRNVFFWHNFKLAVDSPCEFWIKLITMWS